MTMRKGKEFLKNKKETEQDNPRLWFPLFFTSLSTRTWPLHFHWKNGIPEKEQCFPYQSVK